MSGKMAVLACMLEKLRPMGDRIVVVSNSTLVLDLVGTMCRERSVSLAAWPPLSDALLQGHLLLDSSLQGACVATSKH